MINWFFSEEMIENTHQEHPPLSSYIDNNTISTIKSRLNNLQDENYKLNKEINHTYLNVLDIHKKITLLNDKINIRNKEIDSKMDDLNNRIVVVENKISNYVLVE